jgi:hypothetical protein
VDIADNVDSFVFLSDLEVCHYQRLKGSKNCLATSDLFD